MLVVAVPLAAVLVFNWWRALEEGRALAAAQLRANAAQVSADIESLYREAEWILSNMALRPAIRQMRAGACADELALLTGAHPAFYLVTLWHRDGSLLCSSIAPDPAKPAPRPHQRSFDEGMAADGLFLSDLFVGPITGRPIATFTYPVRDPESKVIGLLSLPVRLDYFAEFLGGINLPPGSSAGIVDRAGTIAARRPDNARWQGKSALDVPGVREEMLRGSGVTERDSVDGVRRITAFQLVPKAGWHVFVGARGEDFFAGFRRQLMDGVAAFLAIAALSLGLAFLLGRGIVRRLRRLQAITDAVTSGQLAQRAPVDGADEIAAVAEHVNHMLDALGRSEAELREKEDRYRTLAESSPDAILIHQDDRCVFVNRAAVELFRAASAADLIGKPSLSLIAPEYAESSRERAKLLYGGEPQPRAERVYIRLDGTPIDVEIAAAPLVLYGKPAVQVTVREITARKEAERLLRASMKRAQDLSARLLVAEEAERKRIAHDLHDQLGQELTALKIRVETIARSDMAPATRAELLEVATAAGEALKRVRQMSVDLRPPQLDSLGLSVSLRSHAQRLSALGAIRVHFESRGFQGKVPANIEIMCFRVAQEALTNVMRHSGAANAWIDLAVAEGSLRLSVRDDGGGFDAERALDQAGAGGGFGLLGMQERVALAGGTLDIHSNPGQGCTVTASFPLPGPET